jgi:acyl dehydratase
MRLLADGFLLETASMGAPGIEEVKWARPVMPGDALTSVATVLESRASRSRPDLGLVRFGFEMTNQRGELVFTQTNWILIGRRGAAVARGDDRPASRPRDTQALAQMPSPAIIPYLEDLSPGDTQDLGSYRFEADDIVRFARLFDPQPFHVDPAAAKESLFGGLCASGWQTAAIWMKLMIASRERALAEAARGGPPVAQLGPSPGFKNLKWSKPVYAGDTIAYSSTIAGARPSGSRPGWGLASHRNSGVNQNGEEVFSFDGLVFWERRP